MAPKGVGKLLALAALSRTGLAQMGQSDMACESLLTQSSAQMNGACCGAGTTCTGGVPSACGASCARVFMPFWSQCSAFVHANLPELVRFGNQCEQSGGSSPSPPAASSGQTFYLQVPLSLQPGATGNTDKRKAKFEQNFRSDLASALDLQSSQILIDTDSGDRLTVDIFATSSADAQRIQQDLQTQLSDAQSQLMTGFVSSKLQPNQHPQMSTQTLGSGAGASSSAQQQCVGASWCAPNCCETIDGGGNGPGTFNVFVDNSFSAYVNGEELGSTSQWADHSYHFAAPCGDGNVYAIHGIDTGGPAAIIASITNCGDTTITSPAWRCTSNDPGDDSGWADKGFDDTAWPIATQGGLNGAPPWGVRPGIEMGAHWIWAENLLGTDEVWCRIVTGSHDYDDGMYASVREGGHNNGQIHIGADDMATIYVNGDQIGETTPDQWDQTERFAFTADCSMPTTYGFRVPDNAGAAMLIATINHCGEESDTNPSTWKCSSSCDEGWEASGFDDSAWPKATSLGINGLYLNLKYEVSDNAYFIYNAEQGEQGVFTDLGFDHDERVACCRYVSDHRAINCNAARMRYTEDYLYITQCGGSNMLWGDDAPWCNQDGYGNQGTDAAMDHYQSTGRDAGYIWHSELCNPDGSDIVVTQECHLTSESNGGSAGEHSGQAECGAVHGIAYLSVDNGYDFYVNGDKIGSGSNWMQTDRWTFEASCDENTVYGIDAWDEGGIASMIGTIYHCDEMILTSNAWKCLPRCAEGATGLGTVGCTDTAAWNNPDGNGFDDWWWTPAATAGDNGVGPWGHRPQISGEAHWIWSADPDEHNEVRCRYESSHQPIDCPAAQSRYWQDYNDVAAADVAAADIAGSIGMEAWDHFNSYGKHEGRIWHSELCNPDGTNKRSMCERKHTSDQYEYDFMTEPLGDEKSITFSVKANNDACIGFFENQDHTGNSRNVQDRYTIDLGAQYEIVLCGWGGTQSVIREEAQGDNHATMDTTGYLDKDDYRQFWASAANGLVRLGAGNDVGSHTFLTFQDPNDVLDVNWAAVATGWGSEGDWIVCIPEKCTGTHDAVSARLSGMEVCDGCGNGCGGMCNPRDCATGTAGCPETSRDPAWYSSSDKMGFTGGGFVNPRNEAGDSMTFHLAGCKAGPHSLGWVYQLAPGTRGGLTNRRSMDLNVNGVSVAQVDFKETGGWNEGDWREVFQAVQLLQGENTVVLTTTGSEGPNFDSMEVNSVNGGTGLAASSHGVIHITADNGYILYVNGVRIGAGGNSMGAAHNQHNDWTHTDAWTFVDSCDTPTTYAIHALDSEGIAAIIGDFTHCGRTTVTDDQWRCAAITSMTASDHGGGHLDGSTDKQYVAGPAMVDWAAARQYCQSNYDDLASIHSAEEQELAYQACADAVGDVPNDAAGSIAYGCWIGLNDQFREARYVWTDGTSVDFMNWQAGNPDNSHFTGNEPWNTAGVSGDQDVSSIDIRPLDGPGTEGRWNDNIESGGNFGSAGADYCPDRNHCMAGFLPLCETADSSDEVAFDGSLGSGQRIQYLGCFHDALDRDGGNTDLGWTGDLEGDCEQTCIGDDIPDDERVCTGACRDLSGPSFNMGVESSPQKCAELCAGYSYFGLQDYNQCFCDNAGAMTQRLSEDECNTPCQTSHQDDTTGDQASSFCATCGGCAGCAGAGASGMPMCGGPWRNSVYQMSNTYWESPGFYDGAWQAAADLGPNGVAPWFHRPGISDTAHWIWTPDAGENGGYTSNGHVDVGGSYSGSGEGNDNIFCRYTQPNQEINCYAAAAKYLEDNPDAKADLYPAWLHYVDIGKAEGRAWPSGLCNTCSETTHGGTNGGVQTNCDSSNYNGRLGQCFNQGSTTDGSHHPSLYDGGIGVHGEQYVESHSGGGLAGTAGFYTYEEGLRCTDKCRGMHDAAVAEMVGATSCHLEGDICHGGHYGHGFANFQNPTGDTLTFKLHSCNAGRHRIAITYALASDDPPRPLSVTVNGHPPVGTLNGGGGGIDRGAQVFTGRGTGMVESALQFPATGSWTTWGKVFSEVMLLDGENEITLTAIQNSGANIDSLEVYPHDDHEIGSAFVEVDNYFTLFINNHMVGSGEHWDQTEAFNFQASCDEPTVYAIHGIDGEAEAGVAGAGIIAEFNHCGEVIRTNTKWKCTASDLQNAAPVPPQYMDPNFDDSTWQVATSYGKNGDSSNYWYHWMERPVDEIGPGATWIWTSDGREDPQHPGSSHNDVFCRYVSNHEVINCKAAAIRYHADYGQDGCRQDINCDAFAHFKERGKFIGRIWHSELCEDDCGYTRAAFDWIDASRSPPLQLGDDSEQTVPLPFPFPFYGQVKTRATISANGFLTFSGEHHTAVPGQSPWGGESFPIPSSTVPNDLVAPFWSDLNPGASGRVYTTTSTHCARGISRGNVCCAPTCGQCGGSGCQNRPGGRNHCCSGSIRDNAVKCSANGGVAPCVSDGNAFTVEWSDVPYYSGVHGASQQSLAGQQTLYGGQSTAAGYDGGTNHFEVTLYSDGKIKFQYKDMTPSPNSWAPPSVGVENAAGSEGMQISYDDPTFPQPNTAYMIGKTCGRSRTMYSIGWCPNYCPGSNAANCPGVTLASTCDYAYGDRFCQENYGGQLAGIEDQQDYDRVAALIPNDQTPMANIYQAQATGGTITGNEKYMLGLHFDATTQGAWSGTTGRWEYTDGRAADLDFLASHSQDGLRGSTVSSHVVYTASYTTAGAENPDCDPATGCGLHDCCTGSIISGFICEYYGGPASIGIGLAQQFDGAEEMCQKEFGGHLLSIHDHQTFEKLKTLTTGYTNPVLIGLRSDGAGNWEFVDGTTPDMDFLRSISADGLAGGGSCEAWAASSPTGRCLPNSNVEDQAVLHPDKTLHDMGRRNGGSADAGPYAYACSAWGNCAAPSTECNPLAHCNTCQASGTEAMEMTGANVNDCLTCQSGYRFVDGGYGDCTGTCEPLLDNAAHYIAGTNLNNQNAANGEWVGNTAMVDWTRVAAGKRVPDPQEGRAFARPWEWRHGEKTMEQCRHECLQHPECAGIEFCGPEVGGKHACTDNECILLSATIDSNDAAGWNIYTHAPAGTGGGGH